MYMDTNLQRGIVTFVRTCGYEGHHRAQTTISSTFERWIQKPCRGREISRQREAISQGQHLLVQPRLCSCNVRPPNQSFPASHRTFYSGRRSCRPFPRPLGRAPSISSSIVRRGDGRAWDRKNVPLRRNTPSTVSRPKLVGRR